jgi:hypothetical protein
MVKQVCSCGFHYGNLYGSRVKKTNAREPHDASHPRQSHSKDAKREGRTSSWNQEHRLPGRWSSGPEWLSASKGMWIFNEKRELVLKRFLLSTYYFFYCNWDAHCGSFNLGGSTYSILQAISESMGVIPPERSALIIRGMRKRRSVFP